MSNFTIHDLPRAERPRERLKQFGSEALSAQGEFGDTSRIKKYDKCPSSSNIMGGGNGLYFMRNK